VLPYVFQGAVEQHHWLNRRADDGTAWRWAETTPGR